MRIISYLFLLCIITASLGRNVNACGPDFDNAYLVRMNQGEFLAIPEGYFYIELSKISGDTILSMPIEGQSQRVADADIKDLQAALKEQKIAGNDYSEATTFYHYLRGEIIRFSLEADKNDDGYFWMERGFRRQERKDFQAYTHYASAYTTLQKVQNNSYPVIIPIEFRLYSSGAIKYHFSDYTGAIEDWEQLLQLPEHERRYKTVWASYMIGMAYLSMRNQPKAITYFIQTRDLAQKGYSDSLNLTYDSLGFQALAEFESNDPVSSIQHYLKQMDLNSLNWVCKKVSETSDETIDKIARDETGRNVLIAWAISRPMNEDMGDSGYDVFFDRLATAIEQLKEPSSIGNTDRIAWLYYNKGYMQKAQRWVQLTKPVTPLSQYIDYKLTLRDGHTDEAIQKLAQVIPAFEQCQDTVIFFNETISRHLNSEIAVLKLSQQEYTAAFELLLKGKYWEDIAYVAEKVLTVRELEKVLKSNQKNPELLKINDAYVGNSAGLNLKERLDYLLARRLARQEQWDKAIRYLPGKVTDTKLNSKQMNLKETLVELRDLILKAGNKAKSNTARAEAYYEAGNILRKYGMELMGTELDPDGYCYSGAYPYYDSLKNRFGILSDEAIAQYGSWNKEAIKNTRMLREKILANDGYFHGSKEEEKRVLTSLPSPNKRFHYRYKAAELMWKSAQLLPDNDALKAKALCRGGTFIKTRDPQYADRFYKTLIRTCPNTKLGKLADKIKWFPEIKD